MPAKIASPAVVFVVGVLKEHPEASYAEVVEAAREPGYKIAPVVYGRARAAAGLPPKDGKKAKSKSAAAKNGSGIRRGPGRPKKADDLSMLVERVRHAERLEAALREIQAVIRAVVG